MLVGLRPVLKHGERVELVQRDALPPPRAQRPGGQEPLTADFELVRGIPVRGRVLDEVSGRPPKRATVEYYPLYPNVHASVLTRLEHLMPASSAPVQSDGSFRLTALPGPGIVLVTVSPRDSYASAWLDAFREDMHAVLLAELDLRFQPVEGLLAALRAS